MSKRNSEYKISKLILNRWSKRAMTGERVSEDKLKKIFEAARWAPSSFNNQPWRFIYSLKNSDSWQTFLNLLAKENRRWAKKAGALVLIVSKKTFDYNGKPSRTHSFDTGAAWQNLALEGARNNLVVHAMEGFDYEKAREELKVPEKYQVEAMIAIGKPGDKSKLPADLKEDEKPSKRKSLDKIIFKNQFKKTDKNSY